jgi:hypothetical protein
MNTDKHGLKETVLSAFISVHQRSSAAQNAFLGLFQHSLESWGLEFLHSSLLGRLKHAPQCGKPQTAYLAQSPEGERQ